MGGDRAGDPAGKVGGDPPKPRGSASPPFGGFALSSVNGRTACGPHLICESNSNDRTSGLPSQPPRRSSKAPCRSAGTCRTSPRAPPSCHAFPLLAWACEVFRAYAQGVLWTGLRGRRMSSGRRRRVGTGRQVRRPFEPTPVRAGGRSGEDLQGIPQGDAIQRTKPPPRQCETGASWSLQDSNLRHPRCERGALPAELSDRCRVGAFGPCFQYPHGESNPGFLAENQVS
jgi:hypothetical protein